MSDTERLEAAARELDHRACIAERAAGARVPYVSSADEDRRVAVLLFSLRDHVADGTACRTCSKDALALADAVLGVPASPKEQTDACRCTGSDEKAGCSHD